MTQQADNQQKKPGRTFPNFVYYWAYVLAFSVFAALGCWLTGGKVWQAIGQKLHSGSWWADQILATLLFTVIGGVLVYMVQETREYRSRKPYLNARLVISGLVDDENNPVEPSQPVYWREAQTFQESEFEEWKFIKSTMANYCWIKTSSLAEAKRRWYDRKYTEDGWRYCIDFSKIDRDKDVSKWNSGLAPKGYVVKQVEELVDPTKKKVYRLTKVEDDAPAASETAVAQKEQ